MTVDFGSTSVSLVDSVSRTPHTKANMSDVISKDVAQLLEEESDLVVKDRIMRLDGYLEPHLNVILARYVYFSIYSSNF